LNEHSKSIRRELHMLPKRERENEHT